MNKLYLALLVSFFGHIVAWFHMQGQFRYEWAKSLWWVVLGGIPISLCFYYGTRWYYEYFNNYWYVRPMGFGMATFIFSDIYLSPDLVEVSLFSNLLICY